MISWKSNGGTQTAEMRWVMRDKLVVCMLLE
jgi:hypothetical protein